ncbi:cytochrome P450 [Chaetomidium leptoderma]|uniref:Cytochrome P450 n=1 Tax=Chaetomidium leptoderma TaxID=669021 RepID=A0AAN7A129_9PEZI|nr:cytochrome P450 [Chaetomidium leptoderma]
MMLTALLVLLPLAVLFFGKQSRGEKTKPPPRLNETIPFVSNLWQFMTNKRFFITRARTALQESPVVRCRLGPLDLHLVGGGNNASAIFRASCHSDPWILRIMQSAGYMPADIATLTKDDSGRGTIPRPGSTANAAGIALDQRIWHALHRMYDENLVSTQSADALANHFQTAFHQQLVAAPAPPPPVGGGEEWVDDVHIFGTLRRTMATAATHAVLGSLILDVNPGFVDAFWEYERYVETLEFGLPEWLNRSAVRARARFRDMCRRWYEVADRTYDWAADDASDTNWEPAFGSPVSRGLARWAKSFGFSADTMGPLFMLFIFGLHANAITISTWIVMELVKDPDLFRAVKDEVSRAESNTRNDSTARTFDHRKLTSLPLLQSVYTEVMRLRVGVLITRTSTEPVTVAEYTLPKGSIFQAPTEAGHLDEAVWSTAEHPASDFWAYRQVTEKETRDETTGQISKELEFSFGRRSGSWFPFGGGLNMCPGRNFAKPEVFLAVATVISNFEIEYVAWLKPDGSPSKRPAQNDANYASAVAAVPDRELKVRWRKIKD